MNKMKTISGKLKERRPSTEDYKSALLRMIENRPDLLNDKDLFKQYLFLNIKFVSGDRRSKPEYTIFEDILARFNAFCLLTDMLGQLTPVEFVQMFPIRKTYDGKKYQCKDYFSTMEALKECEPDQPIGKDKILYFLWDYDNDDIMNFEVEKMCCLSDLRRAQGGQGLMEEFMHEQGFPTYTLHEKEGYLYNNLTGKTQKICKPKKRVPKFMSLVEGGK